MRETRHAMPCDSIPVYHIISHMASIPSHIRLGGNLREGTLRNKKKLMLHSVSVLCPCSQNGLFSVVELLAWLTLRLMGLLGFWQLLGRLGLWME